MHFVWSACMHLCMYVCMYVCTYVNVCVCVWMLVCLYASASANVSVPSYEYVHVYEYVNVLVYVCVHGPPSRGQSGPFSEQFQPISTSWSNSVCICSSVCRYIVTCRGMWVAPTWTWHTYTEKAWSKCTRHRRDTATTAHFDQFTTASAAAECNLIAAGH